MQLELYIAPLRLQVLCIQEYILIDEVLSSLMIASNSIVLFASCVLFFGREKSEFDNF